MKEKDKEKQRSIMTQSKQKALESVKKRLAMAQADRQVIVPKLREESRQKYLGDRKVGLLVVAVVLKRLSLLSYPGH